jgi:hypothetical protein
MPHSQYFVDSLYSCTIDGESQKKFVEQHHIVLISTLAMRTSDNEFG